MSIVRCCYFLDDGRKAMRSVVIFVTIAHFLFVKNKKELAAPFGAIGHHTYLP